MKYANEYLILLNILYICADHGGHEAQRWPAVRRAQSFVKRRGIGEYKYINYIYIYI